jgi:mannose-1-phosphate guanylyltransferase
MAVLPADHVIPDEKEFLTCLSAGKASAEKQQSLIVFGIKPAGPETGYGYIKAGNRIGEENGVEIYPAEAFAEKPAPDKAKKFVESGRYYWNSGMFVWTYSAIMGAIREYMPRLFEGLERIRNAPSENQRETIAEVYSELESVSIDYGVMEKAANRVMVRGNFRWDDVGSWLAMERIREKDESGNVSLGKFVGIDTRDSIIVGDKPLIAAIGLSNMIIVATDDVVLVCPKEKAQEVKQMVKKLLDNDLREYVQ